MSHSSVSGDLRHLRSPDLPGEMYDEGVLQAHYDHQDFLAASIDPQEDKYAQGVSETVADTLKRFGQRELRSNVRSIRNNVYDYLEEAGIDPDSEEVTKSIVEYCYDSYQNHLELDYH